MDRREFMEASAALSIGALGDSGMPQRAEPTPQSSPSLPAFQDQKSRLKITGVRMVHPRLKKPLPS